MANDIMDATNALPQVLVSQQLAATETTQLTASASTSVKIAKAVLTNTSGAAVTINLSLVKTGGTAGATNRVLSDFALAADDTLVLDMLEGHFLGPGDFISAIASAAMSVALVISGVVFS